ncbi:Bestrophin-2 [Lamellibrachia satsuma]|nr:Bestrophin-2 [Lamellibrachia satsuma]
MTVTYTAHVATSSVGCFLKLLLRWRGSLYKLLWREFVIFTMSYFALSFAYRFGMDEKRKRIFELVARYCEAYNNLIPVAFVLGFYVAIVVERWNLQYNNVPWPDRLALFVTASVRGADDRGRLMRRTIMRYVCLSYVITMASISSPVKKRFPSFTHMTEAGFMLVGEESILIGIKTPHNKYFIPLVWATSLVARARKEGRIRDDFAVKTIIDEINQYRGMLGNLFNYDSLSIPLVYTQVVTLAVYMFFLSCLMGRQFLKAGATGDVYIPVFTLLQFFFYMGWLKVAETLMNPFGEDDDDFDINMMIDRNLQVSYLIVDEMHADHPHLIKDQYWDSIEFDLPYTPDTEQYRLPPRIGSANSIDAPSHDYRFTPHMPPIQEPAVRQSSFFSGVSINTFAGGDPKLDIVKTQDLSKNTEYFQGTTPNYQARFSPWKDGAVDHGHMEYSDIDSDEDLTGAAVKPSGPAYNNYKEGDATRHNCAIRDIPSWTVQPCMMTPDNRSYMVTISDFSDRYPSKRVATDTQPSSVPRTTSCTETGQSRTYPNLQSHRLHRSISFQHDSYRPPCT